MILVDSSVWIDYFNGTISPETDLLNLKLGEEPIAAGDLILSEVLQGFRSDSDYRIARSLMSALPTYQLLNPELAITAADRYRSLRKLGITVRKTSDIIIGSYCIDKQLPLLFSDRDFDPMVQHLGLQSALN
jgi:predicted nucleic acid-binding protein